MKRLIELFLVILLTGCKQEPSNHPVFNYYPPSGVFDEGFVSKYYNHFYPDNTGQRAGTEVSYTKLLKLDDSHYMIEEYNAGFDLMSNRFYRVEGDTVILERGIGVRSWDITDTTALNLLNGTLSVWEGEKGEPYQVQYTWGDKEYLYTESQLSVADTTVLDKPAKVFHTRWNYREVGSDSLSSEGDTRAYYVQGLGFYGSDSKGPTYRKQVELMEQMPVDEFERRANHGEHRVAWIDPSKTISDDANFKLCGHERRIADYYNSSPDGRYLHSKRAMMDTIFANLDRSKLFDQNGSLVFRFVVNCEGKAGRFIAEGYDPNYQPMEFRQKTVQHLYGILQKLEDWRPVVLDDGARDAYLYINIKIAKGEIIDILP